MAQTLLHVRKLFPLSLTQDPGDTIAVEHQSHFAPTPSLLLCAYPNLNPS